MYLIWLSVSAVLCGALFAVLLMKNKAGTALDAFLTVLLSAAFGLILSKLVYFLCKASVIIPTHGIAGLFRGSASEFSFVGAAAGAVAAVLAVFKAGKKNAAKALSAFAPAGALMVALARFGEFLQGTIGYGEYIENQSLCFFPIAVQNEWQEWYGAVFMLEGLLALICAIFSLIVFMKNGKENRLFLRTVFYLAVPQIISESLRAVCPKWGFVRIEQVLCTVIAFAIILTEIRASGLRGIKAYMPLIADLFCVLVCIGVEFALDKTTLPNLLCYGVMVLALLGMSAAEIAANKRICGSSAQGVVKAE